MPYEYKATYTYGPHTETNIIIDFKINEKELSVYYKYQKKKKDYNKLNIWVNLRN